MQYSAMTINDLIYGDASSLHSNTFLIPLSTHLPLSTYDTYKQNVFVVKSSSSFATKKQVT